MIAKMGFIDTTGAKAGRRADGDRLDGYGIMPPEIPTRPPRQAGIVHFTTVVVGVFFFGSRVGHKTLFRYGRGAKKSGVAGHHR